MTGTLARVFLAASAGTLLGAFAEPQIVPHLPPSWQTPMIGKAIHASIAGVSTTLIYWAIAKAG